MLALAMDCHSSHVCDYKNSVCTMMTWQCVILLSILVLEAYVFAEHASHSKHSTVDSGC